VSIWDNAFLAAYSVVKNWLIFFFYY